MIVIQKRITVNT
ncbi:hypothetical protein FWK35_00013555 [Aphis craccivora]|uniref:Uncharacterized protein n=1 Tax=Aphis craccivora TaxID=307492 RepID=A0A6G0ZGM6_APHCR|nr:hypothetical protein FWK35_00013555 [Aphis craccivora]